MTDQDRAEFGQRLQAIAEYYRQPLAPASLEIYFRALQDLPLDVVAGALNRAVMVSEFMPTVAKLRQLVEGRAEDRAVLAYQALRETLRRVGGYRSVQIDDPMCAHALARVYGGWVEFADDDAEHDDGIREARRKEFLATYRRAAETGDVGMAAQYFAGRCEMTNQMTVSRWNGRRLPPQDVGVITRGLTVTMEQASPRELPAAMLPDRECVSAGTMLQRLQGFFDPGSVHHD